MNRAFDVLSNLCDKILDDKYKLYEENIQLQQENKQLKENWNKLKEELKVIIECSDFWNDKVNQLQVRIDKAIEYIDSHKRKDEFLNLNEWGTRDLLEILKGEE